MGTVFLTVIGLAITASQFSCTKGSAQTTTGNVVQLNKIIYLKSITVGTSASQTYTSEIWTANFDGSNATKVPITLPSGVSIPTYPKLSPDGKLVIFETLRPSSVAGRSLQDIYTCSIDGSNLTKIISGNVIDAYNYERVFLCGAN